MEVLHQFGYPVHIITKSDRILEDIDLLEAIAKKSWCTVSITVTTTNPQLSNFLDGRAPSPQRRLEIIRQLKTKAPAIQTGVLAIPIVPFMNDQQEQLEQLFEQSKKGKSRLFTFWWRNDFTQPTSLMVFS